MNKDSKIINFGLPLIVGILFIIWWQLGGLHSLMHLKPYQLPIPSQILETLREEMDIILKHTRATVFEAVIGLIFGSIIGFVVAVIATMFPNWGYGGLTLMSAFNAIPIVALAPVMNNWFGMGVGSKIAVVTVFTMAAMAINSYRGFTVLKPFSLDLMRSYAASRRYIFFFLQMPNSLPNILTALKISTTSSMIAAICSEFFSSYQGIGYELSTALKMGQMPMAWSYIIVAAFFGILMYSIIMLIERFAIKWHTSQR